METEASKITALKKAIELISMRLPTNTASCRPRKCFKIAEHTISTAPALTMAEKTLRPKNSQTYFLPTRAQPSGRESPVTKVYS